ncbi:putative S-adenosyl-L-methionine-dependent methyltransferase [Streptomyces sp. ADI93-02]|nr:putative S-adenosyl-L-methionine-dependent methyltransferase [Streptomyces sp. ADI93-02]
MVSSDTVASVTEWLWCGARDQASSPEQELKGGHMGGDLSDIDAVARTACGVTALRATGHDLGPSGQTEDFTRLMGPEVAVRAHLFDDYLRAVMDCGHRQVVLLASGMDSRPSRLNWLTDAAVFDLDQGPVPSSKSQVIKTQGTTGTRRRVKADLRDDGPARLRAASFGHTQSDRLAGRRHPVRDGRARGRIAAGHYERTRRARQCSCVRPPPGRGSPCAATDGMGPSLTGLWRTGPTDPDAWLSRHGRQHRLHELADVTTDVDRDVHAAYSPGAQVEEQSWLATAHRPGDYRSAH